MYLFTDSTSANRDLPAILQFSGSSGNPVTKYDICLFFAKTLGIQNIETLLEPVRQGNLPGETRRPRDCHLSNKALEQLGIDVREDQTFFDWFTAYLRK
jgi:S-adenosylmethionine synthetase